jgi:hypothetical protein
MMNLNNGAPVPPADPEDLKQVWKFGKLVGAKLSSQQGKGPAPSTGGNYGIQSDLLAERCSPGANAGTVMLRCQFLKMSAQQGLLAHWQHVEEFEDIVFQVFATYPVHFGQFDFEALAKHLREKRP